MGGGGYEKAFQMGAYACGEGKGSKNELYLWAHYMDDALSIFKENQCSIYLVSVLGII